MPDNFIHGDDETMIVSYGFMRTLTRELDEAERRLTRIRTAVEEMEGQCHSHSGLCCNASPCVENVSRDEVLAIINATLGRPTDD